MLRFGFEVIPAEVVGSDVGADGRLKAEEDDVAGPRMDVVREAKRAAREASVGRVVG